MKQVCENCKYHKWQTNTEAEWDIFCKLYKEWTIAEDTCEEWEEE